MHTPANPQISPDGKRVAFELSRTDWEENAFETEIRIASRTFAHAQGLAATDARARAVESYREAVRGADVVALCTHSGEPVIELEWLSPGTHVTSVGFSPPHGELARPIAEQGKLFVESRAAAFQPPPAGCMELVGMDPARAAELGELLLGRRLGRASAAGLTAPWLWQAGIICGGAVAGALIGLLQWTTLPRVRARWISISTAAGVGIALIYLIYKPLTVLVAPVAAALAAIDQGRLLPHAGQRLGPGRVERHDAGVGVRTAEHAADQLAGQVEIRAEAGAAGDLVDAIRTDRACADVALPVRSVRRGLGHGIMPFSSRRRRPSPR